MKQNVLHLYGGIQHIFCNRAAYCNARTDATSFKDKMTNV